MINLEFVVDVVLVSDKITKVKGKFIIHANQNTQ